MTPIEQCAKICHEANKAYCETINDFSQTIWALTPAWQKKSIINGVRFSLDNPDATPTETHNNWMEEKERNGWTYGPFKKVKKKEHPCMIPYESLPAAQKIKDGLFIAIVDAFFKNKEVEV